MTPMKVPFHFVSVAPALPPPRRGDELTDPVPVSSFSDIWEGEGQWLMGPRLLSDIVHFLKGRSMIAEMGDTSRGALTIMLPLPMCFDEVTQSRVPVSTFVPEALQRRFENCIAEITDTRTPDIEQLRTMLGRTLTVATVAEANAVLRNLEREREQRDRGQLWKIAAASFGFNPWMLPRPAGMAT